jgi:hypothetical protein
VSADELTCVISSQTAFASYGVLPSMSNCSHVVTVTSWLCWAAIAQVNLSETCFSLQKENAASEEGGLGPPWYTSPEWAPERCHHWTIPNVARDVFVDWSLNALFESTKGDSYDSKSSA